MRLIFEHFVALIACAAIALVLMLPGISKTADVPIGYLTRDLAQIASLPFLAGFLSNLGVLSWAGGFFVAAFTSALLGRQSAQSAEFLGSIAILTMFLCADDFFLLHERVPIDEKYFFLAYALTLCATFMRFPAVVKASPVSLAVAAAVLLGGSVGVDLFQNEIEAEIGELRILLEDGCKFVGSVLWLCYIWKTGLVFSAGQLRRV